MARGLKRLAVLLPMLPAVARAQDCFQQGMQYEGHTVIAPGYVRSPAECQMQCVTELYCAYFTWKAAPNSTLGLIGPGGCLKYNDQAVLVPAPGNASDTVSGPNACATPPPPNATVAPVVAVPNGTIPSVPAIAPTETIPPVPTVPGAILPTGVPTLGPINGTAPLVNGTGAGTEGGETSGGGGFPWWAILLIALVVVGIGAAVLFGMCEGGKKKKKDKKVAKKSKKEARQEVSEAQALMRTEAPPPVVEPAMPQQPMAAPMMQYEQMAAPVATAPMGGGSLGMIPQPQPVFGSGGQVYNSQGQVVYMQPQAAPMMQMQQMPMMQPQFR